MTHWGLRTRLVTILIFLTRRRPRLSICLCNNDSVVVVSRTTVKNIPWILMEEVASLFLNWRTAVRLRLIVCCDCLSIVEINFQTKVFIKASHRHLYTHLDQEGRLPSMKTNALHTRSVHPLEVSRMHAALLRFTRKELIILADDLVKYSC
jgi:hypothetical protein